MARTVKVMVACGSGIATSMHVVMVLKEKFAEAKLNVTVDSCSVNELQDRTSGYDIIVTTAKFSFEVEQTVFNAVPILTGIGEEEVVANIIEKIRELSEA